jgi:hypothetical protein
VPPNLSNPSLLELRLECAAVSAEFRDLAGGLGEAQLAWSPRPLDWSIAQCLEHLVKAAGAYRPKIEQALRAAEPGRRSEEPLRAGLFGGWLIALAGPGAKHKLPCPRGIAPGAAPAAGALARFLASQETVQALIDASDGLDLNRVPVTSPLSPFLTLSLGEALTVVAAHARRHLDQARRVRAHACFPA